MAYNTDALNELSQKVGIQLSFVDPSTQTEYTADVKSKKTICKAMGYPADTNAQLLDSLRQFHENEFADFVPFTRVVQEWELKPFTIEIVVKENQVSSILSWVLTREDGSNETGQINIADTALIETSVIRKQVYQKRRLSFLIDAPLGYHNLSFLVDSKKPKSNNQTKLIVVPQKCYMPNSLESGARVWGFPVQLYAISSTHNWGMGDFSDLKNLAPIAKNFGASLIGINPLNALFTDNPDDASPYCASSRVFLNPLYIDTDVVPEAQDLVSYTEFKNSQEFVSLFKTAKQSDLVLYREVAQMKYKALRILFDAFKAVHINDKFEPITARGQLFQTFCDAFGQKLTNYATFQAIRNVRTKKGLGADCWWNWGKGYENPSSKKVQKFQQDYADDIEFIKYMQFLAFEQYEQAGTACLDAGMCIGLYTDLPVGVGENSAEVWSNQVQFLQGVTVGAPPDMFNKKGQDWSLSGFNPIQLKKNGYDLYTRIIGAAMNKAGAVRIDHAFGLSRLFLRVPKASGAYLTYNFKDMMGIVALESVRRKCIVIAEDLGTAPYGFNALMRESNALSFGIFHLKRNENGLIPPEQYDHNCLISSGTHDLPTYAAFWKGLDLELGKKMKTISVEQYRGHILNRINERKQFLKAFADQCLPMPETINMEEVETGKNLPDWFIPNTYAYLARTNSMILLVRIEDIVQQYEQVNLPGTYMEYPNWRYKLPVILEGLSADERMIRICDIINKERPL